MGLRLDRCLEGIIMIWWIIGYVVGVFLTALTLMYIGRDGWDDAELWVIVLWPLTWIVSLGIGAALVVYATLKTISEWITGGEDAH